MPISNVEDVFNINVKPKETVNILKESLVNKDISLDDLFEFYNRAKDPQRGTCLSALAEIVKDDPKFVKDHIDFIVSQVGHKANRINWEASEIVARTCTVFPTQTVKAISALQKNANGGGTVIKWSAAYALTEIAKAIPGQNYKLLPFIEKNAKSESNSGVKKIYLQYLKELKK